MQPLAAPCLALLVMACGSVAWALLPAPTLLELMAEGGPVESATLFFYLPVLVATWASRRQNPAPVWPAMFVLMAGFLAREMDMHKYLDDVSVLKLSYFTGSAPVSHKLSALVTWTPPLLAAAYLAAHFAQPLWRGLRAGRATAVTFGTVLACILVSKLLDRSVNVLRQDFGISSTLSAQALQLSLEEPIEMAIPVLVLLGLLQQWQASAASPRAGRQLT